MASKKKCPDCGYVMSQSEWTGNWYCENFECTVCIKADGSVHHKSISLADMGKKRTGEKKIYGVRT